ncbi:hypothetical protein FSARC_15039 [Fusarium sarcochroum]|uniref:Ankyrin n=1 Tax=Fusarium sarcochroum TaxID=1208366 RepID=A0A8H4SNZ2_9HYPO|nr:hypothetical protein FSARC_15039 [Fusarium sarcochroum]
MRLLLHAGADINAQGRWGGTVLHETASDLEAVQAMRLLLDSKADINVKDKHGCTPLHYACEWMNIVAVRLVLENGASVNEQDCYGRTPFYALDYGERRKFRPYGVQVLSYDLKPVITLLTILGDHGADFNAQDNYGRTLLHVVAKEKIPCVTELILDYGANIDTRNQEGKTVLFQCSDYLGSQARLLINKGANVNLADNDGNTLLHRPRSPDPEMVQMLLDYGADVNALNNEGDSPLASLMMKGEYAEEAARLLVERGGKDIRGRV